MPEAQLILSQAVLYIACAPKSNAACRAISSAMKAVEAGSASKGSSLAIPAHLMDAHYKGAAKLGHGLDYQYPHDYPGHYVAQQYLPDALLGSRFYEPTDLGYEARIKEHLAQLGKS